VETAFGCIRIKLTGRSFWLDKPVIGMATSGHCRARRDTAMASALSSTTPGVTPSYCWQAA